MSILNIKNIIDVSTIIQSVPLPRRDFRNCLFVYKGAQVNGQRINYFTSVEDVVAMYGSNTEPVKAAQTLFSGGFLGIKPNSIFIANFDDVLPEVWTDVIAEILSDPRYYMLSVDNNFDDVEMQALIDAVESASKISYFLFLQLNESVSHVALQNQMFADKIKKSMWIYNLIAAQDEYKQLACISYFATVDFTSARPLGTLAFKQFSGITPTALTDASAAALLAINGNFYTTYGEVGRTITYKGTNPNGDMIDTYIGADYLNYNITYNIFDLLISLPRLAYTASDFTKLEQAIAAVFVKLLQAGFIAPGTDPNTGIDMPNGYSIDIPTPASIPSVDKAAGILQGITAIGLLAGSVVKIVITNTLKF